MKPQFDAKAAAKIVISEEAKYRRREELAPSYNNPPKNCLNCGTMTTIRVNEIAKCFPCWKDSS